MKTVINKVNRYRTQTTRFLQFNIPVENLEVESYTKENGQSRMKGLSVFNFDTITLTSISDKGFFHAIGWTGTKLVQLVLKQKTNDN